MEGETQSRKMSWDATLKRGRSSLNRAHYGEENNKHTKSYFVSTFVRLNPSLLAIQSQQHKSIVGAKGCHGCFIFAGKRLHLKSSQMSVLVLSMYGNGY